MNPKNQVGSCWKPTISRCLGCLDRRGPGAPDPRTGPDQPGRARQIVKRPRPHQVINAALNGYCEAPLSQSL